VSPSSGGTAENRNRFGDRAIEVLAVLLLGIATIGSAWCGYQASSWNSEEGDLAREALDAQVEGARLFGLATQTVSYDTNMVAQYAQAVVEENDALIRFYRATLIRPAFLPVLDRWEEDIARGEAPTNLLADQEYLDEQLTDYRATASRGETASVASQEAGENAEDYVLTTLLFASALFFAGVTTSFRVRFARLLMLAGATLLIAYCASQLVEFPIV
jgi:hypothetical protein